MKLRRDDGAWEAYEQVLAVMLHELVHNDIGPHDGKFFALLAELEKECEDYGPGIGTGAASTPRATIGAQGGGGIETGDAKTAAVDARRRRAARGDGTAGGRRLGGAATLESPRSAAAEAAEARGAEGREGARAHGRRRRPVGRRG